MSESMIKRVARAINDLPFRSWDSLYEFCLGQGDDDETARYYADQTHGPGINDVMQQARCALRVLRDPTDEMLNAWALSGKYKDDWRKDCAAGWSAMIDAALSEREKGNG